MHWRNQITIPNPFAVDPTLHWANPNNFPAPQPPFLPFPPGYPAAQFPVPHVTHVHGLVVESIFDGVPDEWFTAFGQVGPSYVTNDYRYPNEQPSTQLWYHDHVLGVTRLGVYGGLTGNYFIRDPDNVLDFPPAGTQGALPSAEFEIPLVIADRSFYPDGSLFYPTVGDNPDLNPYWRLMFDGNTQVVNGKVWPNMNVERRQYRFRILIAPNQRFYRLQFSNGMNFTVIGSDGGYLPAPQMVPSLVLGVTERIDVLVDFSGFAPGTKIQMQNTMQLSPPLGPLPDPNNDGLIMQFTVMDTPSVPPPPLPATLVPVPQLVPNAPTRIKTQHAATDENNRIVMALLDGMRWAGVPPIDFPEVGTTEQWEFLNLTPLDHNKHIHLIEFRPLDRQRFDAASYLRQWLILNGTPPITHPPIVIPVGPYLQGDVIPVQPEETGWKDTIQTPAGMVTRLHARWAPQEIPVGGVQPGQNLFPIDPTIGPGYIWHCHLLEHEDNEMMRPMPLINGWQIGASYAVGDIIAFANVNYRARIAHISAIGLEPPDQPSLWARVNNGNGQWETQVIYNVGDRVLFKRKLFVALVQHQASEGLEPPFNGSFWRQLPTTACGQLALFCQSGSTGDAGVVDAAIDAGSMGGTGHDVLRNECLVLGQAANEVACLERVQQCLATCAPSTALHMPAEHGGMGGNGGTGGMMMR